MDLIETLRSTGAVREFTDQPVDDSTIARILDTARFAPSGGNAQGWHVVVVKDQDTRTRLRDLYLPGWYDYLAMKAAGLRPWSPANDPADEEAALATYLDSARAAGNAPGFPGDLDRVPALLAMFVDLSQLAAMDRDYERYSFAGGASVYPFVWSVLLAARAEGLGGVRTTLLIRREHEVKALLGVPDQLALAAVIALGHPTRQVTRLRRQPVSSFTTIDRIDGEPLAP